MREGNVVRILFCGLVDCETNSRIPKHDAQLVIPHDLFKLLPYAGVTPLLHMKTSTTFNGLLKFLVWRRGCLIYRYE